MKALCGRFLRYRFDSASLVFDCLAAFLRPGGPAGKRALALVGAVAMLIPPVYVLIVGDERFGDAWAFGLTLALFIVILEAPGHLWRHGVANGGSDLDGGSFDWFKFTLLTLASVAAPVVLFEVDIGSSIVLGVVWGMAVIGAQDLVRSGIAFHLALAEGSPVYSS